MNDMLLRKLIRDIGEAYMPGEATARRLLDAVLEELKRIRKIE